MKNYNFIKFGLAFDFMCKCQSEDKSKFLIKNLKNKITLLCLECERKYEIRLELKEIL